MNENHFYKFLLVRTNQISEQFLIFADSFEEALSEVEGIFPSEKQNIDCHVVPVLSV